MAQRPTLAVRTARGYEVATFAPRTFLGGLRHATELALVDGHGICRYASRPAAVGERAQVPALGWRGGRLWATSQVGLERTRGLTLFLSTDVTGELLLILAVVAAATGVAVSGRRLASRLDRDLAFLEVEARGVRDAIGAVAAALPEFDAAGAPEGGLRAALGPSLDQVRTLTPGSRSTRPAWPSWGTSARTSSSWSTGSPGGRPSSPPAGGGSRPPC